MIRRARQFLIPALAVYLLTGRPAVSDDMQRTLSTVGNENGVAQTFNATGQLDLNGVSVATTLDLIEDLHSRSVLSDAERRVARHRLRVAGVVLMPADAQEIFTAATRNKQNESPEFRAIRESMDLSCLNSIPLFPAEIPWFATFSIDVKNAILQAWMNGSDITKAETLANQILDLLPDLREWLFAWNDNTPPEWVETGEANLLAALFMPIEVEDVTKLKAYHNWVERRLIGPMRNDSPDKYEAIVRQLRLHASNIVEDENE